MTLDEIAIRRALTHLGILDGYRDVSSYEAFVETADADGIRERYGRELPTEQELLKALAEADRVSTEDLKAYARKVSWEKRTGGFGYNGLYVQTDPDSLTLINGMANLAQLEPERVFNFDTAAGPIQMSAAEGIAFAAAVGAFVQATFDRRAEVLAKIDRGEIATTEQIVSAFADL